MRDKYEELKELLLQTSPLLTRSGLISLSEDGTEVITILGRYPVDDPLEAINAASLELEAELPRHYALRNDGDDITILQRREKDGDEVLTPIATALTDEDRAILRNIMSAQGGMFKRFGTFRFDLNLHCQGLRNCAHCGEIWKPTKTSPLRCPRCRHDLPVNEVKTSSTEFLHRTWRESIHAQNMVINNNVTMSRLPDAEPLMKDVMSLSRKERDDPVTDLLSTLSYLGEEYDAAHLNLVRIPDLNTEIILALKAAETAIRQVLRKDGDVPLRTDSVRPIGNWPHTAWISFNVPQRKERGKEMPTMSCMLLLDISSITWGLCIAPQVNELRKKHGAEWMTAYRPIREGMLNTLRHLQDDFSTDERMAIDAVPNSPGERMRDAAVVHVVFDPESVDAGKMKEYLKRMTEAYLELVL